MITIGTKLKMKNSFLEQDMASIRDQYPDFYNNMLRKNTETWFEVEIINGAEVLLKRHHLYLSVYQNAESVKLSMSDVLTNFDIVL